MLKLQHSRNETLQRKNKNYADLQVLQNAGTLTEFKEEIKVDGTGSMQGKKVPVQKTVDVEAMITDLRQRIMETYINALDHQNQPNYIQDNPPLELLQEIEQKIVQRQQIIEERRNNTTQYPTAAEDIKRLEDVSKFWNNSNLILQPPIQSNQRNSLGDQFTASQSSTI